MPITQGEIQETLSYVVQGNVDSLKERLRYLSWREGMSVGSTMLRILDPTSKGIVHVAAEYGQLAIIRFVATDPFLYLEPGARHSLLHHRVATGDDALAWAVRCGQPDVIFELYLSGLQDIDRHNYFGSAPLHVAASTENEEGINALLHLGAIVDNMNANRETPLMLAAQHGLVTGTTTLLQAGAYINHLSGGGWTALHHACGHSRTEVINLLLDHGADHRIRAWNG